MKNAIALGLLACSLFSGAHAAGFDCAKASTKVEKQICANPELDFLDAQLNSVYKEVSGIDGVKDSQRKWIREMRNTASSDQSMVFAYKYRIDELKKLQNPVVDIPVVQEVVEVVKTVKVVEPVKEEVQPVTPVEPVKTIAANGLEVDSDGFYIVKKWTVSPDYDVMAFEVDDTKHEFTHVVMVNYFGNWIPAIMNYSGEIEEELPVYITVNGKRLAFMVLESEGEFLLIAPNRPANDHLVKSLKSNTAVIDGVTYDTTGYVDALKMMLNNQAL